MARTSTKGRSTTTSSSLLKNSHAPIGLYCVIILQSLHGLSSSVRGSTPFSSAAPTPSSPAAPTARRRFFPAPFETRNVLVPTPRPTLNNHVALQKRMKRLLQSSSAKEGSAEGGSKLAPRMGSCALVNFLGRVDVSSFPHAGNCFVSTS